MIYKKRLVRGNYAKREPAELLEERGPHPPSACPWLTLGSGPPRAGYVAFLRRRSRGAFCAFFRKGRSGATKYYHTPTARKNHAELNVIRSSSFPLQTQMGYGIFLQVDASPTLLRYLEQHRPKYRLDNARQLRREPLR